jgi:uncharacterized membrane protein YoaK (UPF0700 family)
MSRNVVVGNAFDLNVLANSLLADTADHGKVRKARKRVLVGQEFEVTTTSLEEWVKLSEAKTRERITWAVFAVIAAFLVGAAILGTVKNEFGALQWVWSVAGPIYGGIAGYFFHRSEKLNARGNRV